MGVNCLVERIPGGLVLTRDDENSDDNEQCAPVAAC